MRRFRLVLTLSALLLAACATTENQYKPELVDGIFGHRNDKGVFGYFDNEGVFKPYPAETKKHFLAAYADNCHSKAIAASIEISRESCKCLGDFLSTKLTDQQMQALTKTFHRESLTKEEAGLLSKKVDLGFFSGPNDAPWIKHCPQLKTVPGLMPL